MLRKRRVTIFYMTLLQLSLLVNFQKILLLISQPPVPITFTVMGSRYCKRFDLISLLSVDSVQYTIHSYKYITVLWRLTLGGIHSIPHTYIRHRADDLIEWNYHLFNISHFIQCTFPLLKLQ